MNIIVKFTDSFFISRPVLWIPVWAFTVSGLWRNSLSGSKGFSFIRGISVLWNRSGLGTLFWIFVFSASVGSVYILNQISDRHTDELNEGFPLFVKSGLSVRSAVVSAILFASVSVFLPLFSGKTELFLLSLASLSIGVVYSFKPFYLSGRPFMDFLSNGIGYGVVAFGAGWALGGGDVISKDFAVNSFPYFFLMCAGSISSTIPDMEGDKETGKKTTAVLMGPLYASITAVILLTVSFVSGILNNDYLPAFCAAVSLPLYLFFIATGKKIYEEAVYKAGGAAVVISACLIFPLIILPSVVFFFLTLYYFRFRYGVKYPSLMPAEQID